MKARSITGPAILRVLADGPMRDRAIGLAVCCGYMGACAALRALLTDGAVKRVAGKPGFWRLVKAV